MSLIEILERKGPRKLLALDGGGIHGLISVSGHGYEQSDRTGKLTVDFALELVEGRRRQWLRMPLGLDKVDASVEIKRPVDLLAIGLETGPGSRRSSKNSVCNRRSNA